MAVDGASRGSGAPSTVATAPLAGKLNELLCNALRMGHRFVVVTDEMSWDAGIPADDHPSNWIPRSDDRPPACGESRRLTMAMADAWCLRAEGHAGDHW